MADGKNDARALRILEIMNDYNTLQQHIAAHCAKNPPDQASASSVGWTLLRQCQQQAQLLLAKPFNPGYVDTPGELRNVPNTDVAKVHLQKIILDASARRFQAHKLYLRAAAATRWCQLREQVQRSGTRQPQLGAALQRVDQRLAEELRDIKDDVVYRDLRKTDERKHYWLNDDPDLNRLLAWIRSGH